MKNFFTLLIFGCLFLSCSDDSNEATFSTPSTTDLASKPEADPEFDNSYKGIYKGVVIGGVSGAIYVDILNDNKIWAKLKTTNRATYILEEVPLSGSGKSTDPTLNKYRFANENVSFDLELDDNGNNITVSNFEYFSDKNSKVCLLKERSASLIKCYAGRFTSFNEEGSVNFTSEGDLTVIGLSKKIFSKDYTSVTGEIDIAFPNDGIIDSENEIEPNTQYRLNANLHIGQISGYLKKNAFDGNWMNDGNELGKWSADRIL
ncbi:MAG: hypothetical protein V4666_10450 [Bacteroidota bacterium]